MSESQPGPQMDPTPLNDPAPGSELPPLPPISSEGTDTPTISATNDEPAVSDPTFTTTTTTTTPVTTVTTPVPAPASAPVSTAPAPPALSAPAPAPPPPAPAPYNNGFDTAPGPAAQIPTTSPSTMPVPPPSMPPSQPPLDVSTPNPQAMQAPGGAPTSPAMSSMSPMGQYSSSYSPAMAQLGMQGGQMSYQLPGNARSRAHQREVKRRTKTGCLTCRKRRIKCDEGHPVCRNCVKSKRDCLGYDPVFRQQTTPSEIRPASSSQPSVAHEHHNPYPSAPPGYVPAASQPFAPSVQSDSSVKSFDLPGNHQSTVEPSIAESDTMSALASVQDTIDGSISQPAGTPSTITTPALMPPSGQVGKQEKVKIQDLLALQGIAPPSPYPIVPIQQARLDQIQTVYLHTYAPAIDRFLETRWFRDKGLSQLLTNAQLMAQYSALIDAFSDPKISEPAVRGRVESFEASVVWDTMSICRSARHLVRNGNPEPMQEYDLLTTANRFDVLEALITDDYLKENPLQEDLAREPPPNPNSLQDQLRRRSFNFWNCIGHFLTLHDIEASSAVEIDETLTRCRGLLDQIENRDVIYSIAIGRHLGQRLSDYPRNRPENSSDERNTNTKLLVAQRFIEEESKDKGTTQVVKRLCGMVHRLWELKSILLPRI